MLANNKTLITLIQELITLINNNQCNPAGILLHESLKERNNHNKISVISDKKNKYFYLLIVFAIIVLSLNTHPALAGKPPEGDKGWVYEAKGKRDPFIALVTPDGRIIEPPKPKERTEGPPRLEGLMYDAKGISYAVMDGEVFRAGDMVGAYQIIRIDSNKVIMQKADRVFEVELKKED